MFTRVSRLMLIFTIICLLNISIINLAKLVTDNMSIIVTVYVVITGMMIIINYGLIKSSSACLRIFYTHGVTTNLSQNDKVLVIGTLEGLMISYKNPFKHTKGKFDDKILNDIGDLFATDFLGMFYIKFLKLYPFSEIKNKNQQIDSINYYKHLLHKPWRK